MDSISRLHQNLRQQQSAMLSDDIETLANLVTEQEELWSAFEAELTVGAYDEVDRARLVEIRALVETNQLLAQQSLIFARKVLNILSNDESYFEQGGRRTPTGKSLDIRA